MKELWSLFLTFAKVGVMTFGGGYAMLPILQREVVENKGWATDEELTDYFAIGQCTPGVIAVNTATFIGYRYKGLAGGILATLGVISPSILIISVIAVCLSNFADIPVVQHALRAETAAMTNGGGDGLMPPEAMAQMLDALTLRNMINFGGPQAEEKLTKLLETLQDAVQ